MKVKTICYACSASVQNGYDKKKLCSADIPPTMIRHLHRFANGGKAWHLPVAKVNGMSIIDITRCSNMPPVSFTHWKFLAYGWLVGWRRFWNCLDYKINGWHKHTHTHTHSEMQLKHFLERDIYLVDSNESENINR